MKSQGSISLQGLVSLFRLDKPVGILLLLWPSLWALCSAYSGSPPLSIVLVFILGSILMRSAGCIVNDIWDVDFDKRVARTKGRPLAKGLFSRSGALLLCVLLVGIAYALLVFLPKRVFAFAWIGVFLAAAYPLAKRWMRVPQFFLGATFAWGVPMAYATTGHSIPFDGWVMYVSVAFWIVGYDSLYSLQDKEDDQSLGLYSAAKTFGDHLLVFVSMCYLLFWLGMAFRGAGANLGRVFWVCWIGVLLHLAWQVQHCYGRQGEDRVKTAFEAFVSNTSIGLVTAVSLWLDEILKL